MATNTSNLILQGLEQQTMMHAQDARDTKREAEELRYAEREAINTTAEEVNKNKNAVRLEQEQAQLKVQEQQLQIIENALGGMDGLIRRGDALRQATKELITDAAELRRLDNVTIAEDGFFPWLKAQFQLKRTNDEYRRSAAVYTDMSNSVKQFADLTEKAKQVAVNSTKTITQGMIDKGNEIRVKEAQIAMQEGRIANEANRAKSYAELFAMTTQELQNVISVEQERRLQAAKKKEDGAEVSFESMAEVINRHYDDLGLPNITPQNIKDAALLGGDVWDKFNTLYWQGISTKDVPAIGNNYADSINKQIEAGVSDINTNTPINQAHQRIVESAKKGYYKDGQAVAFEELPLESQMQLINSAAQEYFKAAKETIKQDGFNPYRVLPFEEVAKSKAVQDTKLYKLHLKNLNPKTTEYEQQVFNVAVSAVNSGDLTIREAAQDIETFFTAGVAANNRFNRYVDRHLEPQTDYPYMLDPGRDILGKIFQSLIKTNLMDAASITDALAKAVTARRRANTSSPFIFTE